MLSYSEDVAKKKITDELKQIIGHEQAKAEQLLDSIDQGVKAAYESALTVGIISKVEADYVEESIPDEKDFTGEQEAEEKENRARNLIKIEKAIPLLKKEIPEISFLRKAAGFTLFIRKVIGAIQKSTTNLAPAFREKASMPLSVIQTLGDQLKQMTARYDKEGKNRLYLGLTESIKLQLRFRQGFFDFNATVRKSLQPLRDEIREELLLDRMGVGKDSTIEYDFGEFEENTVKKDFGGICSTKIENFVNGIMDLLDPEFKKVPHIVKDYIMDLAMDEKSLFKVIPYRLGIKSEEDQQKTNYKKQLLALINRIYSHKHHLSEIYFIYLRAYNVVKRHESLWNKIRRAWGKIIRHPVSGCFGKKGISTVCVDFEATLDELKDLNDIIQNDFTQVSLKNTITHLDMLLSNFISRLAACTNLVYTHLLNVKFSGYGIKKTELRDLLHYYEQILPGYEAVFNSVRIVSPDESSQL